ncbi:4-hydroxythreonine-4-phosphate dehydrogenase PdxA [Solirubrobacter soli]|uniref:4-hydroxythreonine-4-phosphate dehydrogenase PdxA n=1 Tax=Solirubrobacter soli TaxID=363832 RepID=UPI0004891149|nr:4-hydroxythreonine-4-phosphate dehydrogenase PdxA [Solirubrobacter soli]
MRPRIAVTMGDPAGVGPEIVAKLFAGGVDDAFVIGDERTLRAAGLAREVGVAQVGDPLDGIVPGRLDARAGAAAYAYLTHAIGLAQAGEIDAIVTAPINKESLSLAGAAHLDHTTALADLTGTPDAVMMLADGDFRVALVTVHVSLRSALDLITTERILRTVVTVDRELRRFALDAPRIAVAGLNPHAGEGGLFGDEETTTVAPAVAAARELGIDAHGPFPPDTIFWRAHQGEFDVVIALYHDQGLIPLKMVGFEKGVNVTLGLPFIRTSVDHGTAFDLAGKGTASAASLGAAYELARAYAARARRTT